MTDEGGNLRVALRKECRLNCSAHVLNTALKNVFEQENKIHKEKQRNSSITVEKKPEFAVIDACNDLVGFIRKSHIKAVGTFGIFSILVTYGLLISATFEGTEA